MKAVIMAGGLGRRLHPLTKVIPKPLLPVGEQSILEITIMGLKKHGFTDIILATNYKSHLFESHFAKRTDWGINIKYSRETKRLGTAGPLKLLEKELKEPFLVMNGDILTNLNFAQLKRFHIENKADFTLVTKIMELPLHYGVIENRNNRITSVKEKSKIRYEINAGIYFLDPSILRYIPSNRHCQMTVLIKELVRQKKKILRYLLHDYWLDIGQIKDYEKAKEDIQKGNFFYDNVAK